MQLAFSKTDPEWFFIFGPKQKSSLAAQYALEHNYIHLVNPSETILREHQKKNVIIEGSADLFRAVQKWKFELTVIFLKGEHSSEELKIKKDYQSIGKLKNIHQINYQAFRKELYPQIIIVYGPYKQQISHLADEYFSSIQYQIIQHAVTANDLISKYSKTENYVLLEFVPELTEVNILEKHFHLKIIHLKFHRTELANKEQFFNQESVLVPLLQKKPYFHTIAGQPHNQLGPLIGSKIVPELIYVNLTGQSQRQKIRQYAHQTEGLVLNIHEIEAVFKKKPNKLVNNDIRAQILHVVFRNLNRGQILFTDYPNRPEEFIEFQAKSRTFKLFADYVKPENYQFSKQPNSPIYFLESLRRKHIESNFSFENQIRSSTKYLVITGPPCSGKTSTAKYISTEFNYKNIQYEPYVASIKEKLIAPEDGEELPFRKIIAHFAGLVADSGNTPLLIDGLNLDQKQIDNWVKAVGPPVVLNLKVEDKELIRRSRKKNESDLAAQIGQQQAAKTKEQISKNAEWFQIFTTKSPISISYQIDFNLQLILAEQLLKDILKPRVYLIQDNNTLLYQNLAIIHNFGYFNLHRYSLKQIGDLVRKGNYRDVILCNYRQRNDELICQDFYWIQKYIGTIRYLSVWDQEDVNSHDQVLHLEPPHQPEKPKPAEGEEGGEAPPPVEEEGEAKKKVFNIYEHTWTKPGNKKSLSQWFHKQKKNPSVKQQSLADVSSKGLSQVIAYLSENKQHSIYHKIIG